MTSVVILKVNVKAIPLCDLQSHATYFFYNKNVISSNIIKSNCSKNIY